MHNGKGLMQSESNYIKIILLHNVFCIIRFFFSCSFSTGGGSQQSHKEKDLAEILRAEVLKTQDPRRGSSRPRQPWREAGPAARQLAQVCGRRSRHRSQRAPGQKVSTVSDRSKLEGRSNFFPTLQTQRSAGTDSTMGPLKPESDNGRGGGTIQLKTKAASSQNSLPEALQTEGKNKRVKIDSTLIHSNCTTGIIGISEVEIIKWQSFKS